MNLWIWLLCFLLTQCLLHLNGRARSLNAKASCFINGVQFISCFHADNLPRERKGIQVARPHIHFSSTHEQFTSGYFTSENLFIACITAFSGRLRWAGCLPSCWHRALPSSLFSRQVLFRVIAFSFWFNWCLAATFTPVLSTGQTS